MEAAYTVTPRPRAAHASTARATTHIAGNPSAMDHHPNHDCLLAS